MNIKNLIVGLAVTTAFGTSAYAGGGTAEKHKRNGTVQINGETDATAKTRVHQLREVSGTILEMKTVQVRGTPSQNLVALVKTQKSDRRVLLDLGPQSELKALNLKRGSVVAAEGPVARLGDHQIIIASRIKSGETILKVERQVQMRQAQRAEQVKQQQRSAERRPSPMGQDPNQVPRPERAPSPEQQRDQPTDLERELERADQEKLQDPYL